MGIRVAMEPTEEWSRIWAQIQSGFIVPVLNYIENLGFSEEQWRKMLSDVKFGFIVPFFNIAIIVALITLLLFIFEMLYVGVAALILKLIGKNPEQRYKWEALTVKEDAELGNLAYPMVLVQIPMLNEREVYQLSIGAACRLSWPSDRILIQILDDSTDPDIKALVETECQEWASKGKNIIYQTRENRNGYKAGNLKAGLKHSYVKQCEYVAMFDADFEPDPDFLLQTIPFLVHNPQLGLVQANMTFVNANECLLTRLQEMAMSYYSTLEQNVGSSTYAFFSFNGTGGVWRMATIDDVGGWDDRTVAEDMDMAVRATMRGWKFLYLPDYKVMCQLPATFKAYRSQQHRWFCGPANLFRKMFMEIIGNKRVALWKKMHVIYSFFFIRKVMAHMASFTLFTIIFPATVFLPEVHVPNWGATIMTFYSIYLGILFLSTGISRSLHLIALWVLFENSMVLHRTQAVLTGLFESSRAKEWVVTEKLGDQNLTTALLAKTEVKRTVLKRMRERIQLGELWVGIYLLICGFYAVFFRHTVSSSIYIFAQAFAFLVIGFGYIGTYAPN